MAIVTKSFFIIPLPPLFLATFMFMMGIWTQASGHKPVFLIFVTLIIISIAYIKRPAFHVNTFLMLCAYASGSFLYQRQIDHHENFYKQCNNDYYDLIGTVTDINYLDHQRFKYCVTLGNNQLNSHNKTYITTNLLISLYSNNFKDLQIGDSILISNIRLKKPTSQSFKQHLMKQGILATIFLPPHSLPIPINRPKYSITRWIFNKKMALYSSLKSKMSSKTFTFFSSLFLGAKQHTYHQNTLKEHFKWWGLSHYLARSGLHLILFIILWKFILRIIPCPYNLKQILLMILSCVYFLLSWSSIPFARAFFTFIIYCLFLLFNKQTSNLHILILVTLIILATNPVQLFFLDFQLSFGLTLALLWFNQLQQTLSKLNSIIK